MNVNPATLVNEPYASVLRAKNRILHVSEGWYTTWRSLNLNDSDRRAIISVALAASEQSIHPAMQPKPVPGSDLHEVTVNADWTLVLSLSQPGAYLVGIRATRQP